MFKATDYDRIPATADRPRVVNAIVEIPKGQCSKFELDKETGLMTLDRCLCSSSHYPGDYGFVPQTLAEDGDSLDILVMVNEATFPGCMIHARVIGMFAMKNNGTRDCKLLAVPDSDPLFSKYVELGDAPPHFLREVENFFSNYKLLVGVVIEPEGWYSPDAAIAELQSSIARFRTADSGEFNEASDYDDFE